MSTMQGDGELRIPVLRGEVLGVSVLRGFAKLSDLARISKPDIFDQKTNPTGTQRDLSPKHAHEAYLYVRNRELAFWPEVFLCARNPRVFEYQASDVGSDFGILIVKLSIATDKNEIAISRVDGNHRLHYADGSDVGYPSVDRVVSFCMAYDLELDQEIVLFRDINANQKAMNTSHLDNIEARLTPEETLKREQPDLFIARTLGEDPESPLYKMVYLGGKKPPGFSIPLRTLHSGITYMLSRQTRLTALRVPDAQYRVIRNYFRAIEQWQPQAWQEPSKYLTLRGAGLWGICFVGAEVIDRVLAENKYQTEDMVKVLKSGKTWDWSNKGDFAGFSGRGGAVRIGSMVIHEFQNESGMSLKTLYSQIMKD